MARNIKEIKEDLLFNNIKTEESNIAEMVIRTGADKIRDYLVEHTSNFNNRGIEIIYLFDGLMKPMTKTNYPKGAYLIDSNLRVSTFNLGGVQIVDHENTKCPVKFYAVSDISFMSNTFETTVDVDYAISVSYYNPYGLKSITALPKICKKLQFAVMSQAQAVDNIKILDVSKSQCHELEIRNFIIDKIVTSDANEYITYYLEDFTGMNHRTNKNVLPDSYHQYSSYESMFINSKYNRSRYLKYFGHSTLDFYNNIVYEFLTTMVDNEWIIFKRKKKINEDFNFNNVQTTDLTNSVIDYAMFGKTREYLESHMGAYAQRVWKIIPVTELDMSVPSYVKKTPAMVLLAMYERYKNLIIIDLDGSVSTFNTDEYLVLHDNECAKMPIKFKNVNALDLYCKNLTEPVSIEYAGTIRYYSVIPFENAKIGYNCNMLYIQDDSNQNKLKQLDINESKIKKLGLYTDVENIIISNKTEEVQFLNHGSIGRTVGNKIHNTDTNETVEVTKSYKNPTYDVKALDAFYESLSYKLDLMTVTHILEYEEQPAINESFDFNSVRNTGEYTDKNFLEHFVVEFLEACSYAKKYTYEILDDYSVDIKAYLIINIDTWPKDIIPFKINKLDGTMIIDRSSIKSLDFMPNEITGSLRIERCHNITEITKVPDILGLGFISIDYNKNLKRIHLNNMSAYKLMITRNKNLTDVVLDFYETGYLKIQNNDNLKKIERFPIRLNGSVILYNNKNLEDISSINDVEKIEKTVYVANTKIVPATLSSYVRRKLNWTTTKSVTR